MSNTVKFNCASCGYWHLSPGIEGPARPRLVTPSATVDLPPDRVGECHLNPPVMHMIQVPSKLDPRQGQLQQLPVYPVKLESGVCSHHSELGPQQLRAAILYAVRAWINRDVTLDGSPESEARSAGLSRIPSLKEAKEMAVVGAPGSLSFKGRELDIADQASNKES